MALHVAVQSIFSKLWNAFFTILYLLTKGAGKNKDAQTKPPPYDTKVSKPSDGLVADVSFATLKDMDVYIKKLERRLADLEKMTKEMAQLDSRSKEINNRTERMEEKLTQHDLQLIEMENSARKMENYGAITRYE